MCHPETSIVDLSPVVSDEEREEVGAGVDDHPELLHEGLAVEEIVGGHQEIPGDKEELFTRTVFGIAPSGCQ